MKPKIIVVDDDNEIRELLQEYLNKNGFETETAESGHVLFKKLEYFPADIIILDIMMPGD
ncbi:MAG: DNA-binding response regulator, partial [Gammaproteobacteria bacterium]